MILTSEIVCDLMGEEDALLLWDTERRDYFTYEQAPVDLAYVLANLPAYEEYARQGLLSGQLILGAELGFLAWMRNRCPEAAAEIGRAMQSLKFWAFMEGDDDAYADELS